MIILNLMKPRLKLLFSAACTGLMLISCIDPFNLQVNNNDTQLVVESLIHNGSGPYRVVLKSLNNFSDAIPESGASVTVENNLGDSCIFLEQNAGTYISGPEFRGCVGSTYTLFIETANGNSYRSSPEKMVPVAPIDSLYLRLSEQTAVSPMGNEITIEGFEILLDTRSREGPAYYRWDYREVFTIIIANRLCWVLDQPREFLQLFGSTQAHTDINGLSMGFFTSEIEYETSYRFFVRQYSLTSNAFNFWNAVDEQRNNTGSIFDPTPGIIEGNISQVQDPTVKALGYFNVSAMDEKLFLFRRQDLIDLGVSFPDSFCDPGPNGMPPPEFCQFCGFFPNSSENFPEEIWN